MKSTLSLPVCCQFATTICTLPPLLPHSDRAQTTVNRQNSSQIRVAADCTFSFFLHGEQATFLSIKNIYLKYNFQFNFRKKKVTFQKAIPATLQMSVFPHVPPFVADLPSICINSFNFKGVSHKIYFLSYKIKIQFCFNKLNKPLTSFVQTIFDTLFLQK